MSLPAGDDELDFGETTVPARCEKCHHNGTAIVQAKKDGKIFRPIRLVVEGSIGGASTNEYFVAQVHIGSQACFTTHGPYPARFFAEDYFRLDANYPTLAHGIGAMVHLENPTTKPILVRTKFLGMSWDHLRWG